MEQTGSLPYPDKYTFHIKKSKFSVGKLTSLSSFIKNFTRKLKNADETREPSKIIFVRLDVIHRLNFCAHRLI